MHGREKLSIIIVYRIKGCFSFRLYSGVFCSTEHLDDISKLSTTPMVYTLRLLSEMNLSMGCVVMYFSVVPKVFSVKLQGCATLRLIHFPIRKKKKTTRRTYILLDRSIDMTVHLSSGLVRCDAAPVGRSCRWIAHPS